MRNVAGLVSQISTASREQSDGLSQISDAVAQLDQVTQQNAALVEESAAAASSLSGQANTLMQLVSTFKLDNDSGVESATDVAQIHFRSRTRVVSNV